MQESNSFWLPDGRIIFAYKYNDSTTAPSWKIGVRQKRGDRNTISTFIKDLRFYTEEEAKIYLRDYARNAGLKPAF